MAQNLNLDIDALLPFGYSRLGKHELYNLVCHRIVWVGTQQSLGLLVFVADNIEHVDFDDIICQQVPEQDRLLNRERHAFCCECVGA